MQLKCIYFLLASIISIQSITAQQNTINAVGKNSFVLGNTDTIYSQILHEKRTLNIYLPEAYNGNVKYPVIYLLDGSANEDFIHICGIVQFLTMIGAMPPTIIIGIANVDRKRDFTFPTTIAEDLKSYPTTGGSAAFIACLEKEIQPYIETHYAVSDHKTIIGQSLGGLVATEILFTKPSLFTEYIIVSPSLWWDNESLLAKSTLLTSATLQQATSVYISVGKEGKQMEHDAKQLYKLVNKDSDKNLTAQFHSMPHEDHATILHNCIYNALLQLNRK